MSFHWIASDNKKDVPANAVYVGADTDGSKIYVGRANYSGDLMVAKVIPGSRVARPGTKVYCSVSYGGNEFPVTNYEVLCGSGFQWVQDRDGKVPSNAVVGGKTAKGENLYVGRAKVNGVLTCGKIQPSHGSLYIPYGNKEHSFKSYEVLVSSGSGSGSPSKLRWVRATHMKEAPAGAIRGGFRADNVPMYVGRCTHEGREIVCKVLPDRKKAWAPLNGRQHEKSDYEILCGDKFAWIPASNGQVPPKAVACGTSDSGKTAYIGRGWNQGDLTVGKVIPHQGVLYLALHGEQVCKEYEVLVEFD